MTGMSAFVSAILIFVGSCFLLLMLILGAKLAYFVTASVTLAFLLIMGVVWSINPLGPLGESPEFLPEASGEEVSAIDFGPASEYPDGPWAPAPEGEAAEEAKSAELDSAATDFVTVEIEEGKLPFDPLSTITVAEDASRLAEIDGDEYGLTTIEVTEPGSETPEEVFVLMQYDPGNQLGPARMITLGTLILLALHLFGLSRAERKVKAERAPATT